MNVGLLFMSMHSDFESVIFDIGGVILNISYTRTIEEFTALCGYDVSSIYAQHSQTSLFDEFETGRISSTQFRTRLQEILGIRVSDQEIDAAWNAMLLDLPKERVDLLRRLGQHKRIFLLSNTNEIHKIEFDNIVKRSFGHELLDFSELFEKAYYSHLVGDRKPSPGLFKRIIEENNLDASKTLFIDDTQRHVQGALSVGLRTLHLTPDLKIETLDFLL